jgi:hypothetical protein
LCSPGSDPVLDQPNRRIRTRTYGGVGGAFSDGRYILKDQKITPLRVACLEEK